MKSRFRRESRPGARGRPSVYGRRPFGLTHRRSRFEGCAFLCLALGAAGSFLGGSASAAPVEAQGPAPLAFSLQKARLDNGLRVVLNADKNSPNVAICVTYDVGARNEQQGQSGFAHLFEHMMFQGSKNVSKGEHFTLISARGGTLNGTTSSDRTNYFETLPSNELALGLWLEADRMKSLAVTPENMENQRAVVQEEYRMRVSNQAYAMGYIRLKELVFEGHWPYAHDPIGSMEDLDAARFEWVRDFHGSFYAPNNAVLTVAGDFDADEAMRLIREYFGGAKAQPKVPPYAPPPPPEQAQPRVLDLEDKNAKTRGVFYGWLIPKNREPEHYALELAAVMLGDGESSRLHQRLVRQDAIARSVDAWTNDHRGPDLLALRILLTERANLGDVERVIDQELQRLSTRGPSPAELEKAKNRVSAFHVFGLESNLQRAIRMGSFELFYGDARLLERELDGYLAVSSAQVQEAVKKYLTPSRRSTVRVHPPVGQPAKAAPAKPAAAPVGQSAPAAPAKPVTPKAKAQNKAVTP